MNSIVERQGSDRGLLLQRAADSSHRRTRRLEALQLSISLLLAGAGLGATLYQRIGGAVAVAGAIWAVLCFAVIGVIIQRDRSAAACIQEMFDTWLYELPLSTGSRAFPDEELLRRSRGSQITEERMRTWYPDVTGLPRVFAIMSCQRVNLLWDSRLRRRYAFLLECAVVAWLTAGLTLGAALDSSLRSLLIHWAVPSSAALILLLQMSRQNRESALGREQLVAILQAELDAARFGDPRVQDLPRLEEKCKEVQQGLFALRRRLGRVPGVLYERYRPEDEADMRGALTAVRARLQGPTVP